MGMLLHGTNKPKLAKELTKQALSTDFKGGLGFPLKFDKWLNDFVVYWKNKDSRRLYFVTQTFDKKAIELLNNGGKILFTIKKGSIKPEHGGNITIGFSSIFWDTAWFLGADPSTLGILCNPNHPALAEFSSEYYSNYQWQYAMANCNAINLAALKVPVEPIVRIIDDWFTNRQLALIFEAQIGKGKLLICGADLLRGDKRPEPRQLKYSLLKYMETDKFNSVPILQPNDIKHYLNN